MVAAPPRLCSCPLRGRPLREPCELSSRRSHRGHRRRNLWGERSRLQVREAQQSEAPKAPKPAGAAPELVSIVTSVRAPAAGFAGSRSGRKEAEAKPRPFPVGGGGAMARAER